MPTQPERLSRFLTTFELADLLRTSPSTVRYWRTTGYGPAGRRIGRRVLYDREDVESWLGRDPATRIPRVTTDATVKQASTPPGNIKSAQGPIGEMR